MDMSAAKQALQALADLHDGRLTPEVVIAAAKPSDSPLHAHFDWNNKTAAHSWRIEQARTLIRSVRVEIVTGERIVSAPAFLRDPEAASDRQGYVSISILRRSEDVARDAMLAEFGRAAAALSRARVVAEALGLAGDIDGLLAGMDALRGRLTMVSEGAAS